MGATKKGKGKSSNSEFKRSLAVIIGINDYGHGIPSLKTAGNDAIRLAHILSTDYQYEVELLVEDVTLSQLNTLLTETLPGKIGPDDRLVFYFAGHGIALEGDDGPAGYLIPQDAQPENPAGFLEMTCFHDALTGLGCRHLLIILDCCFAGAMRWATTRAVYAPPKEIHRERYNHFIQSRACQLITSAAYDQQALDILSGDILNTRGDHGEQDHSPFALALFEALKGEADTFPPAKDDQPVGDGLLTVHELYQYLRDYVELNAAQQSQHYQTPGLWPLKTHDKGEYVFLLPGRELDLPPAPELTYENNPYRGLQSFEEKDADLFFGRTGLVEELAEIVIEQPLTVVLGASGTGKSSLVKAGLVPFLKNQEPVGEERRSAEQSEFQKSPNHADPLSDIWHILPPLRPTDSPIRRLGHLLRHHLTPDDKPVKVADLYTQPDTLAQLINTWCKRNPPQKLLLIVDQFEELVTLCRNDRQRKQFILLLTTAVSIHPDRFRVVFTLRSDFESQIQTIFTQINEANIKTNRFIVPPMDQSELREVVEGPASVRVLYFDPPKLVDRLINEVIQTPGALPLLSFTLSEMYIKYIQRQSDDRALTQADYESLGGVIGSLRNRATEEYEHLDADHQATMRRIMLRMIAIEGGELARRRVPRAELDYPDEAENQRVEIVLKRLIEARLLVSSDVEGEAYVEPAHDALVRAWDKLLLWSRQAEEYLSLQRRLTQAANDWVGEVEEKEQQDLLWDDDPRLPQLVEVLNKKALDATDQNWYYRRLLGWIFRKGRNSNSSHTETNWLNQNETHFVQRSVAKRLSNVRRVTRLFAEVVLILLAFSLVAFILQRQAVEASNQAEERRIAAVRAEATAIAERDIARSRQLASASVAAFMNRKDSLALLLAIEAGKNADTSEAFDAVYNSLSRLAPIRFTLQHQVWVTAATWNSDESRILTRSMDGTARVWDGVTGQEMFTLQHKDEVEGARWNEDESRILTWSSDIVRVWDGTIGREMFNLQHESTVTGAHWNKDETRILTWSSDIVRAWNGINGREIFVLKHKGGINHIHWNRDETRILTSSEDGTARVWDGINGREIFVLKHKGEVYDAYWNKDETRILTISDGTAQVWNGTTGQELLTLHHDGPVLDARWDKDELRILTKNDFGIVRVWNGATSQELSDFQHENSSIDAAIWNSDGSRVLIINWNTVRVWDSATGQELLTLHHNEYIEDARWNEDETRVLTTNRDNTVRMWDGITGQELFVLQHEDSVTAVRWNGDETRILTSSGDGTARVWDGTTGRELFTLQHDSWVSDARWNKDETRILTNSGDGTARVWEVATDQGLLTLQHDVWAYDARWNKDETRILTSSDNAKVWNAINGQELLNLPHELVVNNAYWNKDESRILTSSRDDTARVWDAVTGQELLTLQHEGPVWAARWSEDETRILTGSEDGTARIWDAVTGQELLTLQHDGVVGDARWNKDETRILTNSSYMLNPDTDGTARVWTGATGKQLLTLQHDRDVSIYNARWNKDETRILTSSSDGAARVWDAVTGQELLTLQHDRDVSIYNARWNKDETRILTSSSDGAARVWDAVTGQELLVLQHEDSVWEARWNKDETYILTISNGTAQVWNGTTGRILFTLQHEDAVQQARWNKDETRILTCSHDGTARVWETHIEELLVRACSRVPLNMTRSAWQQYMPDEYYRPTCPQVQIPLATIQEIIKEEVEWLAKQGDSGVAKTRLEELLDWLKQTGQYNIYGEEFEAYLAILQAGKNPFGE